MQQITVRLAEDTIAKLDEEADEHGVSRSERIREVIDSRHEVVELRAEHKERINNIRTEYERQIDDLETQIERVEAERDDLRRQLAKANQRIDAANEVVAYAREERSAEQRRREAGLLTRAKWWLIGQETGDKER